MASSLGAALGVAISAAVFSALSNSTSPALSELGRTDNITPRFAAAVGLLFNVGLAVIAAIAVAITVPKNDPRERKYKY
jgi:DHA2 family multidrug resistance protein-like MFS transporter